MQDPRIVYEGQQGELHVTTPGPKREGETEEQWLARVAAKCRPQGASHVKTVEAQALPHRNFRAAWRIKQDKLDVSDALAPGALLSFVDRETGVRLDGALREKLRLEALAASGKPAPPGRIAHLTAYIASLSAVYVKVARDIEGMTLAQLLAYQVPWPDAE